MTQLPLLRLPTMPPPSNTAAAAAVHLLAAAEPGTFAGRGPPTPMDVLGGRARSFGAAPEETYPLPRSVDDMMHFRFVCVGGGAGGGGCHPPPHHTHTHTHPNYPPTLMPPLPHCAA